MKEFFQVGPHVLQVFGSATRWMVAVDGVMLPGVRASKAEAWSAGVASAQERAASALRSSPAPSPAGPT